MINSGEPMGFEDVELRSTTVPFSKITRGKNKGKYRSPSGRVYTRAQVALYHASGGFTTIHRKRKRKRKRK